MLIKRDLISIQKQLVHYDEAREAVLSLSRTATRLAGSSILEIHRGDMESASNTLRKVEQTLSKIQILSDDFSEFKSSAGVVVAFQEYVEAMTLRSFAQSERIPTISELKTDNRSYVLGLLDAVGESRRIITARPVNTCQMHRRSYFRASILLWNGRSLRGRHCLCRCFRLGRD